MSPYDQDGTATVVLVALINASKRTGKSGNCTPTILGAGATGHAATMILLKFGIKDVIVYDSLGAIYGGRSEE